MFEPKEFFRWLAKKSGVEFIEIEPSTVAFFIEDG